MIPLNPLDSNELPKSNWFGNSDATLPYGWAGACSFPNKTDYEKQVQQYKDMVAWVKKNVENPSANALWTLTGDCSYFQFRKKKDLTWFVLKWS